mmetsp:Transcript_23597/g.42007  ORF Transcript_23597/g.42007 Transcript_23597/m.42007 type:complete len:83 (-) Transcript_23597:20-268(-)
MSEETKRMFKEEPMATCSDEQSGTSNELSTLPKSSSFMNALIIEEVDKVFKRDPPFDLSEAHPDPSGYDEDDEEDRLDFLQK